MCIRVVVSLILVCECVALVAQSKVIAIPGSDEHIELQLLPQGEHIVGSKTLEVDSFYMGIYEITYDQFVLFQMRDYDTNDSNLENYNADAIARPSPPYEDFTKGMGKDGGYPAVSITQQGAQSYCQWLYQKTGIFFRLPTELEWEYACKMGQADEEDLDQSSWYFENSFEAFQKVGQKQVNQLGIYDMLGNVAEWTADQYDAAYHENPSQWVVPNRRHSRTVKGGSYLSDKEECTCMNRERSNPRWQMRDPQIPKSQWWNTDAPFVGFRVIMPVHQPSPEEVEAYFQKAIVY